MVLSRADGLAAAAVAFLAANLLHGADHLRQGTDGVHPSVIAGGTLVTAAAVAAVLLALRRHDRAVPVAAVVGVAAAALVTSAHLLPHWSVLSNSYVDDVAVDGLSWLVVLLEIAAAAVLGTVALRRAARGTSARRG